MSERKRIVVGVDGSEDAMRAVRYAMNEALSHDAELQIVHAVDDAVLAGAWGVVYDPSILQGAGHAATDAAREYVVEQGFPADKVATEVLMGNPGAVLARASEEASLIIVGRRAVSGLERVFVGSTSVSVAANASCPVIMVSMASNPEDTGDLGVIGVGVDPGPNASAPLEWAVCEARVRGSRVEAAFVVKPLPAGFMTPEAGDGLVDRALLKAEKDLEAVVDPVRQRHPDVQIDFDVLHGNPVDEIVTRSEKVDLMVVGVSPPAFATFGLGGIVRGVMAHAHCPVALVR